MFDRDNWPGIAMLGICAVVAIALLIEIFTDTTFEYTGPRWLAVAISIFGIGLIGLMSWRAWGGRIRRMRGGSQGQGTEWPHNDVRPSKKSKDGATSQADTSTTNETTEQPPR